MRRVDRRRAVEVARAAEHAALPMASIARRKFSLAMRIRGAASGEGGDCSRLVAVREPVQGRAGGGKKLQKDCESQYARHERTRSKRLPANIFG